MKTPRLRDLWITLGLLGATTVLCFGMSWLDSGSRAYASMLYILAVFLTARYTEGYLWGVLASFAGVLMVNYLFTYPYFYFNFTLAGYPVAILSMLAVAIVTGAMTSQSKNQEQVRIAAEKEKTRSNLLRAVSHDLRTPLTSILGTATLLQEEGETMSPDSRRELAGEIVKDAGWLIKMVENLLTITRIDANESTHVAKEPHAVEEVVAAAVVKFRKHAALPLRVSIPSELMLVPMDAVLMEQVLTNLLENAVRHGQGATYVELKVCQKGDWAVFQVCDDGAGIPHSLLPHLFEGVYRGRDEERQDHKRNLGIGLSVCHTIVRAHGGELTAYNDASGGAVFRFELPMEESL